MLTLSNLSPSPGSRHRRKRVGRGESSGLGKTSGRGSKGQKSRSGGSPRPGFEGGQMPLQRRLPKRGFTNIFRKKWAVVNLFAFKDVEAGSVLDAQSLRAMRLVRGARVPVRLLAKGEIDRALTFRVQYASEAAVKKVMAAGGSVEIVPLPKKVPSADVTPETGSEA
ncbi:MAG: 50S ribosomal protein L15 [Deltaproteobacteria bacterium]|jgi:large subunit ribosomal protein L15|nr:50S ribosomal protein L15 [Deltaproteobacteria bacterium]